MKADSHCMSFRGNNYDLYVHISHTLNDHTALTGLLWGNIVRMPLSGYTGALFHFYLFFLYIDHDVTFRSKSLTLFPMLFQDPQRCGSQHGMIIPFGKGEDTPFGTRAEAGTCSKHPPPCICFYKDTVLRLHRRIGAAEPRLIRTGPLHIPATRRIDIFSHSFTFCREYPFGGASHSCIVGLAHRKDRQKA